MFMPTTEDARVAESAMVAFCTTLNTPVVNIDGLPTGPARAGILVSASEYGTLELWVRVRRIASDEGVTFKFQGDPTELGDHSAALEAALSFSEGMGFLFDVEMISQAGGVDAARAYQIWTNLCEAGGHANESPPPAPAEPKAEEPKAEEPKVDEPKPDEVSPANAAAEAKAGDASADVLEIDAAVEPEAEPQAEPAAASRAEPARPAATGATVLSKFRMAQPAENTSPPKRRSGEKEVGRVALQSEELGGEYVDHAGFLSRLLGSF